MPEQNTYIQQNTEQAEAPPRFPIRWRWTMLVSFTVSIAVLILSLIILDMEHDAWLDSQSAQAHVMVERLGDELKLPMLAGSKAEIDIVISVFNHPHKDDQHTQHAAMAGLAMVKACSKLGILRSSGEPIAFRIGINSGQVIVGNIGAAERLEYTVIGDAVNMASRMGGTGEADQVMLTRPVFDTLGSGFEFSSIGKMDIKGIREPVECGNISVADEKNRANIRHAIALAFDLTLPSEVRQMVGDV